MATQMEPVVLAMVICREISGDRLEPTLHGVMWTMPIPTTPFKVKKLAVYKALTGFHGAVDFQFTITVRDRVIREGAMPMESTTNNPLEPVESRLNLDGLILPEAGEYVFELTWPGGAVIRRLQVYVPGRGR